MALNNVPRLLLPSSSSLSHMNSHSHLSKRLLPQAFLHVLLLKSLLPASPLLLLYLLCHLLQAPEKMTE